MFKNFSLVTTLFLLFTVIFACTFSSYLYTTNQLTQQEQDGTLINISGSMRSMSQRLVKNSLLYELAKTTEEKNGIRSQSNGVMQKFQEVLSLLENGNKDGVNPIPSEAKPQLQKVKTNYASFETLLSKHLKGNPRSLQEINALSERVFTEADALTLQLQEIVHSKIVVLQQTLLYINIVIFILFFATLIFIQISVRKPLLQLSDIAHKLISGDFSIKVPLSKKQDEIGLLYKTFSKLITSLRHLLTEIEHSSQSVSQSVSSLYVSTNESTTATKQTANLAQVSAEESKLQSLSLEDVLINIQTVNKQMNELNNIQKQLYSFTSTMKAQTIHGIDVVQHMNEHIKALDENAQYNTTRIEKLVTMSTEMNAITSVITDIANQTNLLSLNASIEAARANEYGAGFAVVANEIRNLSEATKKAVIQISALLTSFIKEVSSISDSLHRDRARVSNGLSLSTNVTHSFGTINTSIQDITTHVQKMSHQVDLVNPILINTQSLLQKSMHLSYETTKYAEENAAAAEQLFIAIKNISNQTQLTEEVVQNLTSITNQFKVK